jgi:AbrB family looped-hinge helix DNA binding protein
MRVTSKGQVTIPRHIREKLGIKPETEVEFVEENDRVYIVIKQKAQNRYNKFRKVRGAAPVRMTTEEIMSLTRRDQ